MIKTPVSEKQIQTMVEQSVSRALRQLLTDPDAGLELTAYAKRRLERSLELKHAGKTTSLKQILAKYR
jgi:hypothetical protein